MEQNIAQLMDEINTRTEALKNNITKLQEELLEKARIMQENVVLNAISELSKSVSLLNNRLTQIESRLPEAEVD